MESLAQPIRGHLYIKNDKTGLLIDRDGLLLHLRYGLVVRGPEYPIFPAFVMDDWGQERNSLDIYQWIATEGQRFPRSDVFGFELDDTETQYFLRELETFYKFPVYVYASPEMPVSAGTLVTQIILPDAEHTGEPVRIPRPDHIPWPLRHGNLTWWRANPHTLSNFGFTNRAL